MILLIDNYDSFVFNLARYFRRLGQETRVVRNDALDAATIRRLRPAAIVISPGPCTPNEAGCSLEIVRTCWRDFPMLGVCLGHQTIAAAWGAEIVRAPEPMHGRASPIWHDGRGLFADIPHPLTVGRYHSLIVEETSLPSCLEVQARTSDNVIMALRHREAPILGVQFHPESILTVGGYQILSNFLTLAGIVAKPPNQPDAAERLLLEPPARSLPLVPVTF